MRYSRKRWIKAYRAVGAGRGIMTDAIEGAVYFFPRRSTAELWGARNNAPIIEREIRIDTATIVQVREGNIPYFACGENDVIIRMFPDVRNPQIPKDIAEILVCDDRFIRKVRKPSITNPSKGVICAKKFQRPCKPIDPKAEYLFRTIWDQGRESVWASRNKLPAAARKLKERGWIKIIHRLTPSQNLYGKYLWTLELTKKGRREYTTAVRQRIKKYQSRQLSLFNPRNT
jgi:hypothetical protein